jgi:predicted dehydrogenase
LDYLSHITRRYCQIQYEGGTLALDFIANTLSHNDEVLILKADRNDLLQRMHETILLGQTVENDQVCTCKDARMTMELIDAIERSAKEGKWICRETL